MSVISSVVPPYGARSARGSVYHGHGGYGHDHTHGAIVTTSRTERERTVVEEPIIREPPREYREARTVIQEPVIEHEHHHLHHHIDHGAVSSIVSRRERDYNYEDSRSQVTSVVSGAGSERRRRHRHRHRGSDGVTRYSHSEVDVTEYESDARSTRRRSIDDDTKSDWTMIDVPPGTRRITFETDDRGFNPDGDSRSEIRSERGSQHMMSSSRTELTTTSARVPANGVRRSRGTSTELWTEVTKDLVTRDAIEEMGYPYEETEFYFYIFEYLEKDQVRELIDITAEIRHERVRELEYKRRVAMTEDRGSRYEFRDDFDDSRSNVTREVIRDHVTEVSYEDDRDRSRRRRSRYYH